MNSKSINLNITNIIETDTYEGCTLDHKYSPDAVLYCDFGNFTD